MPQEEPLERLESRSRAATQTVVLGAHLARQIVSDGDWSGAAIECGLQSAVPEQTTYLEDSVDGAARAPSVPEDGEVNFARLEETPGREERGNGWGGHENTDGDIIV